METYLCQVCGTESEKMYCRINGKTLCSRKCSKKYDSWVNKGNCTRCGKECLRDNPYFCDKCDNELYSKFVAKNKS